jgi:RimJ/RimL family protein N-acetyltransferase
MIDFFKATMEDAKLIYDWRLDPESMKQSHQTNSFSFESHLKWFEQSIQSQNREIYLAKVNGVQVGMVRRDLKVSGQTEPIWLLSWLIAPSQRGKGFGKKMLADFIDKFPSRYEAEVKAGNEASVKMAENAGLKLSVLTFRNYE